MQPAQQSVSLSQKAFYFGSGSIATLILEIAVLAYGLSDGSILFVFPLLASPFLGIVGIALAIIALRQKAQSRGLAILGLICGCLCVVLFAGFILYAISLASALQGVF